MKIFLVIILLMTSSVFAQTTSTSSTSKSSRLEAFRRANQNELMSEFGYMFLKLIISRQGDSAISTSTAAFLRFEYGFSDNIAIGTTITKTHSDGEEGLNDNHLYLKGEYNKFFYGFDYYLSPTDAASDKFYTGGNHYRVNLGYQMNRRIGLNFIYQPQYNYDYKDDSTKYISGETSQLNFHYEIQMDQDVLGFQAGYYYGKATTEDGEPNSDDSRYSSLGVYFNMKRYGFEFNPNFSYINYDTFDRKLYITANVLSLIIRKRF